MQFIGILFVSCWFQIKMAQCILTRCCDIKKQNLLACHEYSLATTSLLKVNFLFCSPLTGIRVLILQLVILCGFCFNLFFKYWEHIFGRELQSFAVYSYVTCAWYQYFFRWVKKNACEQNEAFCLIRWSINTHFASSWRQKLKYSIIGCWRWDKKCHIIHNFSMRIYYISIERKDSIWVLMK